MKTEYLRTAKNSYMIVKDADFEFESYEYIGTGTFGS